MSEPVKTTTLSSRAEPTPPKPDQVIPLVHAPDDPGPNDVVDAETEAAEETKPSGWRKLFG